MKHIILVAVISTFAAISSCNAQNQEKQEQIPAYEKIIKDYFSGWLKKDWNMVSSQLADGFTFTSPAPDDHISTVQFKEKCWIQADHIQRFDFIKITGNQNEAFAIIHVITTENKIIRNVEYFNFSNGKIKSIEVFFGGAGHGFPTNVK